MIPLNKHGQEFKNATFFTDIYGKTKVVTSTFIDSDGQRIFRYSQVFKNYYGLYYIDGPNFGTNEDYLLKYVTEFFEGKLSANDLPDFVTLKYN